MSKEKLGSTQKASSVENPTEAFDAIKEGNRSWELVNNLKSEVRLAGLAPGNISGQWSKVRDLNQSIHRTINEYRDAQGAEKQSLRESIQQQIAKLENEAIPAVRNMFFEKSSVGEKEAQMQEIKNKLAKLEKEAQRSSQMFDPENRIEKKVLALEEQLYELESTASLDPELRREQQEALRSAVEAVVQITKKDDQAEKKRTTVTSPEENQPEEMVTATAPAASAPAAVPAQTYPVPQADIERQIEQLAEERTTVTPLEQNLPEDKTTTIARAATAPEAIAPDVSVATEVAAPAVEQYDGSKFFNPFIEKVSGGPQRPWGKAFSTFEEGLQARRNKLSSKGKDVYKRNGNVALRSALGALIAFIPGSLGDGHVKQHRPHVERTAPAPKPVTEHLSISEKDGDVTIKDADQLIGHFAKKLQADYALSPSSAPPAVKAFFKTLETEKGASLLRGEDKASFFNFKFAIKDKSTVMHTGDTISLNEKGEIVLYKAGHPDLTHILIDKTGTKINPVGPQEWKMKIPTHRVATPQQPTKAAPLETPASPSEVDPSVALNNAQAAAAREALNAAQKNTAPNEMTTTPAAAMPEAQTAASAPDRNQSPEAPSTTAPSAQSPEMVTQAPENVNKIQSELHKDRLWSEFSFKNSMEAFLTPAPSGTPEAVFRRNLFSLMKESGTGPHDTETIEAYVARATKSASDHLKDGQSASTVPALYETKDHQLRAHGGDLSSRLILAHEYIATIDPQAKIAVENQEGLNKLIEYSANSMENNTYPHFDGKIAPVSQEDKIIF
jgi:hypothetical protein